MGSKCPLIVDEKTVDLLVDTETSEKCATQAGFQYDTDACFWFGTGTNDSSTELT